MNILICADYAANTSGNFIASITELGKHLRKNKDKVTYAFAKPLTGVDYPWVSWFQRLGFEVIFVDYYNASPEQISSQFLDIILKYKIDLIHSHFNLFRNAIILNRFKIRKTKVILHDHMDFNVVQSEKVQKIKFATLSLVYKFLNINVITVMKYKQSTYPFLKKKCWYIHNGLSLERNVKNSETREETRNRLGIKDNEKLCLVLGWDIKRKGVDIAIKAVVNHQPDSNAPFTVGIVGFSSQPSKNQLNLLKQMSGADSSSPYIHYLDNAEDIFAYHRAADIYLSSSRREAFPYGLLEAISQEKPLVVSDIKGTTWTYEYTNCFVYPVEDAEACAKALYKAYTESKPETNAQELLEKYDIHKWCEKVYDVYKKVK